MHGSPTFPEDLSRRSRMGSGLGSPLPLVVAEGDRIVRSKRNPSVVSGPALRRLFCSNVSIFHFRPGVRTLLHILHSEVTRLQ